MADMERNVGGFYRKDADAIFVPMGVSYIKFEVRSHFADAAVIPAW